MMLVKRCARCGDDHEVEFFEFKGNPVVSGEETSTHWGVCPNLNEPILMHIIQDDATEQAVATDAQSVGFTVDDEARKRLRNGGWS